MNSIPYGRQEITTEDLAEVARVLQSDFLTQGPEIKIFEEAFAQYVHAPYAVAVSNGTAALHLAALALNVKPGQRVITPPITFAASSNCIRYCGGDVTFADVDSHSHLIDPAKVEAILRAHPQGTFHGIVAVDFAGYPADLVSLRKLADEFGLWIIQDACHSPGAFFTSEGKTYYCGDAQLADAVVFSFHPVKHIATAEGGMITTRSKAMADSLTLLRSHGITRDPELMHENHGGWYHEMIELGYNYRLTDMQAALGTSQLRRADANMKRRKEIAARYDTAFAGTSIQTPKIKEGYSHAFHLYVIETENRKELYDFLRTKNIFTQVHYIPTHLMPYYQALGSKKGDLPVAEAYYSRCLSIPMYPSLTFEEQEYVIECVLAFLKK
jgi:UDP-4-amino-4,6-dideoxy-N-acetyl-beta-L-altrosamine transaminase